MNDAMRMAREILRDSDASEVTCPACGSAPGKACYGNGPMKTLHEARRVEALTNRIADALGDLMEEAFRAREALNEIRDEWDASQLRLINARKGIEAHFKAALRESQEERLDRDLQIERLTFRMNGLAQTLNDVGGRDDKSDEWLEALQAAVDVVLREEEPSDGT